MVIKQTNTHQVNTRRNGGYYIVVNAPSLQSSPPEHCTLESVVWAGMYLQLGYFASYAVCVERFSGPCEALIVYQGIIESLCRVCFYHDSSALIEYIHTYIH
eukprot:scpid110206/ scgid27453/ 